MGVSLYLTDGVGPFGKVPDRANPLGVVMSDEIISEDEVTVSPRGRKVEINPEMAAKFAKLKPGQAIRLTDTFGTVEKPRRATVSAIIRKHWRHVRQDDLRIDYDANTGVPCVRCKAAK